MEILIRDYREDDSGQVLALVRELQAHEKAFFDRMRDAADIGPWYLGALQSACADGRGRVLVATRGGDILAYACVLTDQSSAEERDEVPYRYALVQDLVVTKAARGQGLGRRLLTACEAIARAAGVRWLRISHLADNHGAGKAYKSFGFQNLLIEMEKSLD